MNCCYLQYILVDIAVSIYFYCNTQVSVVYVNYHHGLNVLSDLAILFFGRKRNQKEFYAYEVCMFWVRYARIFLLQYSNFP